MCNIKRIKEILKSYTPKESEIFRRTVYELMEKGLERGRFENYGVLGDVLSIFALCEKIIKSPKD